MKWGVIRKVSGYTEMFDSLKKQTGLSDAQIKDFISENDATPMDVLLKENDVAKLKLLYLYCNQAVFK